jgi:hypothetical protein
MLAPDAPLVQEFVRDSLVTHIASRSPAGRPFVTPIWFTAYEGVLWMTTGLGTRVAKNVTAHPNVTLLLWGDRHPKRSDVLRLHARATVHAGLPPWAVLYRIAMRYYLAPQALTSELRNVTRWSLRARYYAQISGGAGHVRVVPVAAETLPKP